MPDFHYMSAVTQPLQDEIAMRSLVSALALLLAASPVFAVAPVHAQGNPNAVAIEACMKEIRSGLKAGQKLTEQQRMVAEEQCRARAEAASLKK
jgi:hypothetical protein